MATYSFHFVASPRSLAANSAARPAHVTYGDKPAESRSPNANGAEGSPGPSPPRIRGHRA